MEQVWLLLIGAQKTAQAVSVKGQLLVAPGSTFIKTLLKHQSHDAIQSAEKGSKQAYRILRSEGYLTQSVVMHYRLENAPENIIGHSAELAFALAFAIKTLHRQQFKPLAATGVLEENGNVAPVEGLLEKLQAALDVLPSDSQFIYPEGNANEISIALHQRAQVKQVELIAVNSLEEAFARIGINLKKIYTYAPYRGLEAFQFEHAGTFFGRNSEVSNFCKQLNERTASGNSSVLVLGASGCGKSSLVLAGVLPELVYGTAWPSYIQCRWSVFRPRDAQSIPHNPLSSQPELDQLLQAAMITWQQPLSQNEVLPQQAWDTETLINWLHEAVSTYPKPVNIQETRFVWVIDQLEELFTQSFKPETVRQFSEFLSQLAKKGITVIVTLRSDYYLHYQNQSALLKNFSEHGIFDLLPIGEEAIEQIIREPAWVSDCEFEQDSANVSLATRIQNDAGNEPGILPLLEFTLTELYQRRDKVNRIFTYQAYTAIDGLKGCIGHRAETLFQELDDVSQTVIPSLIRVLSTVTQQGQDVTARTVALENYPPGTAKRSVIDKMTKVRLFIKEGNENTSIQVRIAHEALLTHWQRAKKQLDNEWPDLQLMQRLEQAAILWNNAELQDQSSLLLNAGSPLNLAEDLLSRLHDELPKAAIAYIEASRQASQEQKKAEAQKRKRQLIFLQLGVFFLSVLTGIAGFMAWQANKATIRSTTNEKLALEQRDIAVAQKLAVHANDVFETDIAKSTLLAIESLRHAQTVEGYLAYSNAMNELPRHVFNLEVEKNVVYFDFSPNGKQMAVAVREGNADIASGSTVIRDLKTGMLTKEINHQGGVIDLAFSKNSRYLATVSLDHTLSIVDMITGNKLLGVNSDSLLHSPTFDQAGKYLAYIAQDEKVVRVVNIQTQKQIAEWPHPGGRSVLRFSLKDEYLITACEENKLCTWVVKTKKLHARIVHPTIVTRWAIAEDDNHFVTVSKDKKIRIWNLSTGELTAQFVHDGEVNHIAFVSEGFRVATSNQSGFVQIWDAHTGKKAKNLVHDGRLRFFVFSKDGKYLASVPWNSDWRAMAVGKVLLWDVEREEVLHQVEHKKGQITTVQFSPNDNHLVTASYDGTIQILDLRSGKIVNKFEYEGEVSNVAISSDGNYLAAGVTLSSNNYAWGYAQLWDIEKREKIRQFGGHPSYMDDIGFSSQGDRIATGSNDGTARVWDAFTGKELARLEHHGNVKITGFAANDSRLVTGWSSIGHSVNRAYLWDWAKGKRIGQLADPGGVYFFKVTRDGRYAVTSGVDKKMRVWQLSNDDQLKELWSETEPKSFSMSAEGEALAILDGSNNTIQIRQLNSGKVISHLRPETKVKRVMLSPDGRKLASLVQDKKPRLLLWDIETEKVYASIEHPFTSPANKVLYFSFSPGGNFLVTSMNMDSSVRLWDVKNGSQVYKFHHEKANRAGFMGFDPAGRYLITSGNYLVHVWDINSGREVMSVPWKEELLHGALFSPDSSMLAIAKTKSVQLWTVPKKRLVRTFRHKNESALQGAMVMDFSADGKMLATGGYDQTTRVWDLKTGHEISRLSHADDPRQLTFLPNGSTLITKDLSYVAKAWHIPTATERFQFSHGGAISHITPTEQGGRVLTANASNIDVWETTIGHKVAQFKHDSNVREMALSQNGRQMVSVATEDLAPGKVAFVWDVNSGKKMFQLNHEDAINNVAFSSDGEHILTGSRDKTVRLWQSQTGKELVRINLNGEAVDSAIRNDGVWIAVADSKGNSGENELHVWDIASKQRLARLPLSDGSHKFSPDNRLLAVKREKNVRIFHPATAQTERFRIKLQDWPRNIALSPNGNHIAIAQYRSENQDVKDIQDFYRLWSGGSPIAVDPTDHERSMAKYQADPVGIWNITGKPHFTKLDTKVVDTLTFSPDGKQVLTASIDGTARVWDVDTGKELHRFEHDEMKRIVFWAGFSPDGTLAALASNTKLWIWDLNTNKTTDINLGNGMVNSAVFSPNGKYLVTAEGGLKPPKYVDLSRPSTQKNVTFGFQGVRLWDTTTGREYLRLPHEARVDRLVFNNEGTLLATDTAYTRGDTIRLWDTATWSKKAQFEILEGGAQFTLQTFSPDDRYFAGYSDYIVIVWDIEAQQEATRLTHSSLIQDIVFSQDGRYLAAAGHGQVSVWDWKKDLELARLQHGNKDLITRIAFTPDGNNLITASQDDTVRIWEWKAGDLIKDACSRLEQNLTKGEWNIFLGNIEYRPTCPEL